MTVLVYCKLAQKSDAFCPLSFQIASNLSMECYALTFGINTFVAVSLQTIITVIVVDETALGLDIVTQVCLYTSIHVLLLYCLGKAQIFNAYRGELSLNQARAQVKLSAG